VGVGVVVLLVVVVGPHHEAALFRET
jgi:hypothetical protein